MLLLGRQEGHPTCKNIEWWGAGVVISLERGADLHTAQLMPLPLTVRLVLPFWYWLTWVVPEKGLLNVYVWLPYQQLGMVELCAKNLQIMRNDFTDYARTFCQLCVLFANYAQIMRNDFKDYARTLPIMRTFHVKS